MTGDGGGQPQGGASVDGEGGSGGELPGSSCRAGYVDWFSSRFAFLDGDAIGTADIPSFPWAENGSLRINAERLRGTGTAVVGQGNAVSFDGARLRFRARFSSASQQVGVALNAAKDGSGGIRLTLNASGRLTLSDGVQVVGEATVAPLESDEDWYVEAHFEELLTAITLSSDDYGSEPASRVVGELSTSRWLPTSGGSKAAVSLAGNGDGPALDEVTFSRCEAPAPTYRPVFVDTFERPDSLTLGTPEFPASYAWTASSQEARIVDGALQLSQLASAQVLVKDLLTDKLRIRAVVSMTGESLWANFNYNVPLEIPNVPTLQQGFWLWGGPDSPRTYVMIFLGEPNTEVFEGTSFMKRTPYFVEFNRDDGVGVLTVRTQAYDGAIISVHTDASLLSTDSTGEYLRISTSSGTASLLTSIHELRVERYDVN